MSLVIAIIFAASLLMATTTIATQQAYAIPKGSKLSLPLEVVLWSDKRNTGDIAIWAEYKEQVEKYKLNFKKSNRNGYLEVEFDDFEPQPRGWAEFYRVCVKVHKNGEVNCQWRS